MPIDVLFYGNINDHRFSVFQTFMELSKEYNLNVFIYEFIYLCEIYSMLD